MKQDVISKLLAICGIAAAIGLIAVGLGQPNSPPVPGTQTSYMVQATTAGPAGGATDTGGDDVWSNGYLWSDALPALGSDHHKPLN